MDPATPANVAKGAAITSILTGTFTAAHALYRGSRHPTPLALSSAVNGGIAGTLFFSIREVAIRPLLQLQRALHPEHASTSSKPSWSQLRLHDVPETILSGALTGGIINAWRRGPVGILSGARTAAIICTIAQFGLNEMSVTRLKIVSRKIQESQVKPVPVPVLADTVNEPQTSIFDRVMAVIGFRKLTDEEYMKALKKQRNEALRRIAILEQERKESEQSDTDREP